MKNSIKIFLILITSLLLINLVNASSIITISSKYETKTKCDEMKKKNTDDNKITVKYSRSECYLKNGKYIYNVCKDGTVCPTGDNDKNYSSQQSTSNNEDIPYKGILDELLRVVKIKKSEKTDNDYEKFLNEAIDYVNKLGEKDKYKNNPKTKAVIVYLQNGLQDIKNDFDKNKNNQDLYDLLCDLGSCDKNNFVTTNTTTNTGVTTNTGITNSGSKICDSKTLEEFYKFPSLYVGPNDDKMFPQKSGSGLNKRADTRWVYCYGEIYDYDTCYRWPKNDIGFAGKKYIYDGSYRAYTVRALARNFAFSTSPFRTKFFIPPNKNTISMFGYFRHEDCQGNMVTTCRFHEEDNNPLCTATVKMWVGTPIEPSDGSKIMSYCDLEDGTKYIEFTIKDTSGNGAATKHRGQDLGIDDKCLYGKWVYVKITPNNSDLRTCMGYSAIVSQIINRNNEFDDWFESQEENKKWNKHKDPEYDCTNY